MKHRSNKADHAVQSYAAGKGGRGRRIGEHLFLHSQNREEGDGGGGLRSIHQQILDPKQCSCKTILPVGRKDRRRRNKRKRKMAVSRAAAAYSLQLKIPLTSYYR